MRENSLLDICESVKSITTNVLIAFPPVGYTETPTAVTIKNQSKWFAPCSFIGTIFYLYRRRFKFLWVTISSFAIKFAIASDRNGSTLHSGLSNGCLMAFSVQR